MIKFHGAGAGSLRARNTILLAALASVALALATDSPALAAEHHPKGDFAGFADCPLSDAALNDCVLAHTTSGEFVVGKRTVPITSTITLQGGFTVNETTEALEFVGAEDGKTLSKTPQSVPGGLAGLINCKAISNFFERVACELTFENGLTGVTATAELAKPASSIGLSTENLLFGEGVALSLPLKLKLSNPFLGESCYIGSSAHPVSVEFTTGTTSPPPPNKPITGSPGETEFKDKAELVVIKHNSLVNNSFAAPAVEGCGGVFSFLIDPLLDAQLGLPAAAGHNTAILNGTLETAQAQAVRESEK
jgi:hypothetical protein